MNISNNMITEYEISMQSAERRVFDLLNSMEWQLQSEKVAILIHPEGVHRCKWDSQSSATHLIARVKEGIMKFFDDLRSYAAKDLKLSFSDSLTGWV
ncbi:StAR- lipid transfer (START) domain containing 4 [Parelaphostrongylus tenuis]|uniref:StAR- lipid transfer (START) domain containing 4 n=1 Tax=Parelaphostrongylus tenuis TaxID=148309 RepID=A0AAD5N1R7_PARTN|nr:StAR- lipid transfer (START) domain containing 4 [Parelaphostrongylus tenuis]